MADALFFQRLYQSSLRKAGGRLGKALAAVYLPGNKAVARLHKGQLAHGFLLIVPALGIHGRKAREQRAVAVGPELRPAAVEGNGGGFIDHVPHLTGQETVVDKLVKLVFIVAQIRLELLGIIFQIRGADGLMGILCLLAALIHIGRFREILRSVVGQNMLSGGVLRLLGHPNGVRTDIGDQANRALFAYFQSLVELLGNKHGLFGNKVQLSGGFLLQTGGGKGRSRMALLFRHLPFGHHKGLPFYGCQHGIGLLLAGKLLFPVHGIESGFKAFFLPQ